MGFLRLLFAVSVVVFHTYPLLAIQYISPVAVNSFFIISGFYMALILNEKYVGKKSSYKLFITNRFLRLYPTYWIILALSLLLILGKFFFAPGEENYISYMLEHIADGPFYALDVFLIIVQNIFLVQPIYSFGGNLFSPEYLIIQPAWSIQVELFFYLLAPFIIRLKNPLFFVLLLIFGFMSFGPPHDSLQSLFLGDLILDRFAYFLLGIMGYKLYRKLPKHILSKRNRLIVFAVFLSVLSVCLTQLPSESPYFIFYYAVLALSIGSIFSLTQRNRFDAALGALSYPVYLSHLFIFKLIQNTSLVQLPEQMQTVITILATLLFSWLLVKVIEQPINMYRQKRLKKNLPFLPQPSHLFTFLKR